MVRHCSRGAREAGPLLLTAPAHVELADITASYGRVQVLRGISLAVRRGEIVSLIGPSGSGKSSVLRVLAGLLTPQSGEVRLDGQAVDTTDRAAVRAMRGRLAIVFQQYNLFQNMDVLRNVTIAPVKVQRRDRREVEAEARALLGKVGLGAKLRAYPDELSGGQQQRVAIARALALRPEILLLDEITSALDPELVAEVLDAIRLLAADGMTMLLVSHEMGFVRDISSRVVFMDAGRVVEAGSPGEIFDAPREARTREFIGKIRRAF
jgi:polar amino acid transport system ATP-binding protein